MVIFLNRITQYTPSRSITLQNISVFNFKILSTIALSFLPIIKVKFVTCFLSICIVLYWCDHHHDNVTTNSLNTQTKTAFLLLVNLRSYLKLNSYGILQMSKCEWRLQIHEFEVSNV